MRPTAETARTASTPGAGQVPIYYGSFVIGDRQSPHDILPAHTIETILRDYSDCFGQQISRLVIPPSRTYIAATDPEFRNVVAFVSIAKKRPLFVAKDIWDAMAYAPPAGTGKARDVWYVFSVCTYTPFRRRGIMRNLFRIMLGNVASTGRPATVVLEVLPSNVSARQFYQSLGFNVVATAAQLKDDYDVMALLVPEMQPAPQVSIRRLAKPSAALPYLTTFS